LKKILSLIIGVLLINTFAFAEFNDIDESHWGYEAVDKMAKVEILTGYPDGSFRPSKNITLAEYASIFSKFFDIKENIQDNYFLDVPNSHWAKGKIESIREYIQPNFDSIAESLEDSNKQYGINQDLPITREIVIYSLNSILSLDNSSYSEDAAKALFTDYDKIIYPEAAFVLYQNNIINGEILNGQVYIHPDRYITRAEISSMFAKLLNDGQKISNNDSKNEFEEIIKQIVKNIKNCNFNEVKGFIYDTAGRLNNIDFNSLITKNARTMIKKYFDKFKYEIVDYGFYSYNKAYVKINKTAYNYESLIKNITTKDLTTEGVTNIINEMLRNYKKLKTTEISETINFIKTNDGWKIVL